MTLDETVQAVTGPDEAAAHAARDHWDCTENGSDLTVEKPDGRIWR